MIYKTGHGPDLLAIYGWSTSLQVATICSGDEFAGSQQTLKIRARPPYVYE